MIINTNTTALNAAHNLQGGNDLLSKSISRLSSGSKITTASDDAAGLAVANSLDAQINRSVAARGNVSNAVSFTQTQDGYLSKVSKALDRMSELSILAQDVTKSPSDLALYDKEFKQLASYVTTVADKEFNGVKLFSTNAVSVTIDSEGTTFDMAGVSLAVAAYTDATGANVLTVTDAKDALTKVKAALNQLNSDRATIGSHQIRLDYTAQQLTITEENLTAASSRIQDVDMATESTEYARNNILVQSATAMLAQANQMPQSVLRLLQ